MSIIIGLTGPTGAGKTSLNDTARSLGFNVIDCDEFARRASEKGTPGLSALAKVFGNEIIFSDGTLNRKHLASLAFKDTESTELLNKTILPFITELVKKEINGNTILDAPTLFESGINKICTKTIAVLALPEIRLKRIMTRDNLTLTEATLRMNAGKSEEFYKANADYILLNNGDETVFFKRFTEILNNITGGL